MNVHADTADTIVAPATPPGEGALALVRLSGPLCAAIARDALGRREPPVPRRATLGLWRDTAGTVIDQCVVTLHAAGASYTGEPALEITCHGNPLIVAALLRDCRARGCRDATGGEFTRRAFLNGRLDLAQAEAVADTIHARSERALAAARRQLAGELGARVAAWTERALAALAEMEAYIDFADEDLPAGGGVAAPAAALRGLADELAAVAAGARFGPALRDGVTVAIAGAPNAGKSSLLNALLGEERALVSAEPGTTRDFIRERASVGGHAVWLVDTAGLRAAAGAAEIERLGMERARAQVAAADFLLLVADVSTPPPALPEWLPGPLAPERVLLALNKCDLPACAETAAWLPALRRAEVSARTGAGVDALRGALADSLTAAGVVPDCDAFVAGERHAEALRRAAGALGTAADALLAGTAPEFAASDVRLALDALGDITGRVDNERVLDKVFATFCIGK
ncbi:MAG: tRNA uridine-5-carboxymethylaminomethyl(34) synthesis GTPase MnmE [Puniceicoccales bacterium]|nr:tRNA uridine-5-carboxymethylaminomethyl(34) synthesis GTPase MnmE [Puniceicoccales bacterium]